MRKTLVWWLWAVLVAPIIVPVAAVGAFLWSAQTFVYEWFEQTQFLWRNMGPDCMEKTQ